VSTLVSRLRARLGPAAIEGGRTGYRLGSGLRVDLDHAAGQVAAAEAAVDRGAPRVALVSAGGAREVLESGLVLTDQPDAAWGDPARVRHADLTRRARHAAAAGALGTGLTRVAVAAAAAAVRDDPFDEAAYRSLMRAQVLVGEPARALIAYERLRGTLARELGVDPAPATRALHLAILREDAAQLAVLGCVPAAAT
jgi:DNA-binding SARP family transcriptional activator